MGVFQQAYNWFDGFVILHGTDTMAYTASALSFMLENLGKTVIVTGSQVRPDNSQAFGMFTGTNVSRPAVAVEPAEASASMWKGCVRQKDWRAADPI